MGYSKLKIPRECEHCHRQFEAKTLTTRFCSKSCSNKVRNERIKAERKEANRQELIAAIPPNRPYISIAEAVLLFGISRDTLYRLVRMGKIPAVNLGERLTRISRAHIEAMFTVVPPPTTVPIVPTVPERQPEKMDYPKEACYTLVEISQKYGISYAAVKYAIRHHNIPQKKTGNFIYVPKAAIDKIFTNKK
jgi:excisionase family DNA binding protein